MKTLTRTGIAFGFAALLPFASVAAQPQLALDTPVFAPSTDTDPTLIAARWEEAEQLRFEGRLDEALEAYEGIVELQIESFENAARTYWVIAEIHNAMGNQHEMVKAMDKVVSHARLFGDNELRARALIESAAGYSRIRNHAAAQARMDELEGMIETGNLSRELREYITRRIRA
ncbi:MAG: hypothetical protein WD766_04865 [Gemmatimonadota bacterium]